MVANLENFKSINEEMLLLKNNYCYYHIFWQIFLN